MSQKILVLVTGLPATGKTTFAQYLSSTLSLPLLSKDTIKEEMFDRLGWSDRAWSQKIGQEAYKVLDARALELLKTGSGVIIESNFSPRFDELKFQQWQKQYGFIAMQIICHAEGGVLFERFKTRALSGARHPGHADIDNLEEWRQKLNSDTSQPLEITGQILRINTTHFKPGLYEQALATIRQLL